MNCEAIIEEIMLCYDNYCSLPTRMTLVRRIGVNKSTTTGTLLKVVLDRKDHSLESNGYYYSVDRHFIFDIR